ncbi:carboxylesterase family protein [Aestuariibaculum sediminum]|uniref:Prolyl oligopeptidase family serine peptidase n=1 Tax=Aestuariibaculum sediminum TaxID=2770637 RepID=A0A8J6Q3F4_9FLAO|nr:alpha/beta fold hydrolase [Aestuariibaculum sediminum]MBD0833546.1 prolyl oligopeptidase family serine peptidase [Aestuariibaculum sediminum]
MVRKLSFILFLFYVSSSITAQQRTGNIVEYFGKEKVTAIEEGKLMHVFKEALMLHVRSMRFNSSTFPEDPVFSKILMNSEYDPNEGDVFDVDFTGEPMVWKSISVDTTNSFNDRDLLSSYVCLKYKSNTEKNVLFDASGHSLVLINGMPHEGDHYDYGWNLIPVTLKKGWNMFVLKVGRFPRIRARLIEPKTDVQFTTRDLTIPTILIDEPIEFKAAIRVINATNDWLKGYTIKAHWLGKEVYTDLPNIPPMSIRKLPFSLGALGSNKETGAYELKLNLFSKDKIDLDEKRIPLLGKSKHSHHKRTFISDIDGSLQYYSVAPSSNDTLANGALFLSVHGASVEAVNQANAYKQKDWGNLIAPTNRRPFGYAWEDLGRLDALEVLSDAKRIYQPDPQKIYLTGHSMGGHGSWYLGATYPDHFAAIAPCAGYPDLLLYRDMFLKRLSNMSEEQLNAFGITPKLLKRMQLEPQLNPVETLIERAGTPSRTLELIRNYLQQGVYILHGEKDNVVPTYIARDMRERLGKFHPDFTYYEYPDGTHWYGDHSVDWPPIFNLFKNRLIPKQNDIDDMEFFTGSPGVSSKSHFVTIHQQEIPFEVSSFKFTKGEEIYDLKTENVSMIEIDFSALDNLKNHLVIDNDTLAVEGNDAFLLKKVDNNWEKVASPSLKEKGPHRNGGFKDVFKNNVLFVYATKGTDEENDWYYNRARFDAETMWYRANGSVDVIRDVDFSLSKYPDRNVVLYGNKTNNAAWNTLMKNSPIQVKNNEVDFNGKKLPGQQWGMYFIVPRNDSNLASVGVVTATGVKGMKAAYMNHYLVNGTTFPDVLLFDDEVLLNGTSAVKCAGFFGNDWSVENGDFEWK